MVLLCFTIGSENKFSGKLKLDDIAVEFDKNKIIHSVYYTKNRDKRIIKTFLEKEEIIKSVCNLLCEYIFENYIKDYVYKYVKE